jgi:hypothetical protein
MEVNSRGRKQDFCTSEVQKYEEVSEVPKSTEVCFLPIESTIFSVIAIFPI